MPARTARSAARRSRSSRPAIERLREEGYDVDRPARARHHVPRAQRRRPTTSRSACITTRRLIPLKTLHFDEGVNITLGLPIVRTSPDHGTAFDIAGKGIADPGAMIAAIRTAGECARRARRGVTGPGALPPLREVIARHGLSASKALGQNFLLDEQLLDRIARVPGAARGRSASTRSGPAPAA